MPTPVSHTTTAQSLGSLITSARDLKFLNDSKNGNIRETFGGGERLWEAVIQLQTLDSAA